MTKADSPDISEIENAYKYCQIVTKHHAKSFYFAAKFLPKHKQKPIYALYALCRHIDDEVDEAEVSSEKEAIAAVENWKQKLNSLYTGEPIIQNSKFQVQDSRFEDQNLVLLAWQDLLKTYQIKQGYALDLMKGVLSDTHINRYENFNELYIYCYRVASTVGLMSSEIFGYTGENTLKYAEALGIAMQLTNILRDIKEDAAMNRIYLPQEDLQKFGVTEKQIFANEFNDNFAGLIKFQIERARYYYVEAEKGIPFLEKDTRFTVLLAARIYARILDEIEKLDYNIFLKRAHTTKMQKILMIPRIRREAKKMG